MSEDSSSKSHGFHFAVNRGALRTEPWTAVSTRHLAKAGSILLEAAASAALHIQSPLAKEEPSRREGDWCPALSIWERRVISLFL